MIKIKTVSIGIERSVTVAPYTVHKVRIAVEADIPEDENYADTLEALRDVVSQDVDKCIEREDQEYGGND